ncbi:hypothetical protein DSLASN_01780 [Desulfoluna limicola]|uniref:Restriction endonuclease type IV Mrr domain-containing protein n=1 Tax=Desulfoluna limicola TaxID=2810562 RepID=A0ABM7PBK4_9BACT|nr:restriction endonuclease [Desulfoluna limicola]BCS94546.1 hypothetical protein DSLASN_01780 [Desulfoluna limicola]
MAILDFKEIPEAHKGGGEQDKFELFSRDFFEAIGYKIESSPGRGADGGKDLIVKEIRKGIASDTEIRWLVSCKHKAHSGSSVSKTDEPEIYDSLKAHDCQGFIGFYSTLPSSGLTAKVESIRDIEHQFFDSSKIEQLLLTKNECIEIAKRYFPNSYKSWSDENPKVAQIFSSHEPIKCKYCGSVLDRENPGIVVAYTKYDEITNIKTIRNQYTCCIGDCDSFLKHRHRTDGFMDAWAHLEDYFSPLLFIKNVMVFVNELNDPCIEYHEQAFEHEKELLLSSFPHVCRNLTHSETEHIKMLGLVPAFLGGFAQT